MSYKIDHFKKKKKKKKLLLDARFTSILMCYFCTILKQTNMIYNLLCIVIV